MDNFTEPIMTAEPEYETNENGELVKITEHYAQGDTRYKIVHNLVPDVINEDTNKPLFRTFSKYGLETALFERGALEAVDAFIDAQTITNRFGQTVPLRRFYNTALTFREDNPLFSQYVEAIKTSLRWTDDQVEELLSVSIAETV